MRQDPANGLTSTTVYRPPSRGQGSGKDAWVRFANDMADSNQTLWQMVADQSELIKYLDTENEALRKRIAERKPKGGRPSISEETAILIRADLERGYSQRAAAVRNGVSAMTVSRLVRPVG